VTVGLAPDQLLVGGVAPKICATSAKENLSKAAEGKNELVGIIALKRGAREFEKKLLERLIRMRLDRGPGISFAACQAASPRSFLSG
jgi:hypothetical protein